MRKNRMMFGGWRASVLCLLWLPCSLAQAGIIFNLTDVTGGGGMGSAALAAFNRAGTYYSSRLSDNMTINLDISMASLGAGVLGEATSYAIGVSYSTFRTAVMAAANQTSAADAAFAAGLPTGSAFSMYVNRTLENSGSPTAYVDSNGTLNNTSVALTRANAKALQILDVNNSATDGKIEFNSGFAWDFDPADGIDSGKVDFTAVAAHEIGHVLGFVSGVDQLDYNAFSTTYLDDTDTYVTPLDFTRFSADSQSAGADIDMTADSRDKYFSIDGGVSILVSNAWSTGVNYGDGRQASHWKDNLSLGLLDPTLAPGVVGALSTLDLTAFDVMGFELNSAAVPEPGQYVVLAMLCGAVGWRRFRRPDSRQAPGTESMTA
jgi:hypothetical protein